MTPRRTFGPTVLVGLGSAALAAVAGTRQLVTLDEESLEQLGMSSFGPRLSEVVDASSPLAGAMALVALAGWGVLLVTRGRVRRVVAVVVAAASAALVATAVNALLVLPDGYRDDVGREIGLPVASTGQLDVARTGWLWALLVASVPAVLAAVAAVRFAPSWPEMGSRYDAPTGAAEPDRPVEEQSNLDLWKSLDEGHDPTS
jgi:uncharacterized membrane protein (TIGR02234 family)